ncbi:hypothetical protein J437_LFUL012768 [Ladona fulva]|uniref:RanBP2-type domain-containing protein n=1 Tax=Ladona fulva TaxID=123851 RepID=A0A8K0PAR1_LADFU|nr:hypothetical protein J437_LFUL012768 [Ladona fulva]
MAHLHCPACFVNPGANPWAMPEHWHCGVPHSPAAHGWGGSMMHLWPHHHPPPPPPPPNVIPARLHSPEVQPNPEEWSGWEDGKLGSPSEVAEQNDKGENEEEDKAPLFIPNFRWSCEHCTFVNKAGTRVCAVCCKTPSADVEPEGKIRTSKEPKDWSDARSHISKKSEGISINLFITVIK